MPLVQRLARNQGHFCVDGAPSPGAAFTAAEENRSPRWQVYFAVEDADAATEKAVSMQAPEDSTFGRLATLPDPAGAMFKIVAEKR